MNIKYLPIFLLLLKSSWALSYLNKFKITPLFSLKSRILTKQGLNPNIRNFFTEYKTRKNSFSFSSSILLHYDFKKIDLDFYFTTEDEIKKKYYLKHLEQLISGKSSEPKYDKAYRKREANVRLSYKVLNSLIASLNLGRIIKNHSLVLNDYLTQRNISQKIDHVYFIPSLQSILFFGRISIFSFLEQKINSDQSLDQQNFSLTPSPFFSYGYIYRSPNFYSSLFSTEFGIFNEKNIFNKDFYDFQKKILWLSLKISFKKILFTTELDLKTGHGLEISWARRKAKFSANYFTSPFQKISLCYKIQEHKDFIEVVNNTNQSYFYFTYTFNFSEKYYTNKDTDFLERILS